MNDRLYSRYAVPDTAAGNDRIYGRFADCQIIGKPCEIEATRLICGADVCVDALGVAGVFRRDGMAIHMSGINDAGEQTGPGFIRALSAYRVHWSGDHGSNTAGLGCNGQDDPAAIVTCDSDRHGDSHYRPELWCHHAYYSPCSSFFTLAGIVELMKVGQVFSPASILKAADARLGRRSPMLLAERPHTTAMRRLLEEAVGVTNTIHGVMLTRAGRWSYRFDWKE